LVLTLVCWWLTLLVMAGPVCASLQKSHLIVAVIFRNR
jgi:hypothetical protein